MLVAPGGKIAVCSTTCACSHLLECLPAAVLRRKSSYKQLRQVLHSRVFLFIPAAY